MDILADVQSLLYKLKAILKHNLGKTILVAISILIYSVISEYLIENPIPSSGIHSILNSVWWTMQTVTTVGYGDVAIVGAEGKINGIFIMIFGVGSFSLLLVSIGAEIIDAKLLKRLGQVRTKMKDHIVICNYSSKHADVLDNIAGEKDPFIVLGMEPPNREKENMEYVRGNPLEYGDMERAGIHNCHTVIIFPNEKYGSSDSLAIDAESILICMTAKKLNPEVNVIIEILNKTSRIHAKESGADEILVRGEMSSNTMVKLIKNPGSWKFISALLSHEDIMDIRETQFPKHSNKPFRDIFKIEENNERKVIAVRKGDEFVLRPNDDEIYNGEPVLLLEKDSKQS